MRKKIRQSAAAVAVCAALLLSASAPAWARQSATATLSGVVTDPNGAVVVVEEGDVVGRRGQQPHVARAGHALVVLQPHVSDSAEAAAHLGRRVRRGVVHDDDFDRRARRLCALDAARQHVRPVEGRDDEADSRHRPILPQTGAARNAPAARGLKLKLGPRPQLNARDTAARVVW